MFRKWNSRWLAVLIALPVLAHAVPAPELAALINGYRAVPADCTRQRMAAVAPLLPHPALSAVRIGPGDMLSWALEQKGYDADRVEAISISGSQDTATALAAAVKMGCAMLRSPNFTHIGVSRSGSNWQIVLARPAPPRPPPPPPLPSLPDARLAMLAAVNTARASARDCGSVAYAPAPPVALDAQLDKAAFAHSRDMAMQGYFAHESPAGERVSDRARQAGYQFSSIGENIAMGQRSIDAVMSSWLTSPGHCANIMAPSHTHMGSAYASDTLHGRPYWTQVFARPAR